MSTSAPPFDPSNVDGLRYEYSAFVLMTEELLERATVRVGPMMTP
jgi:hypothetical protein